MVVCGLLRVLRSRVLLLVPSALRAARQFSLLSLVLGGFHDETVIVYVDIGCSVDVKDGAVAVLRGSIGCLESAGITAFHLLVKAAIPHL